MADHSLPTVTNLYSDFVTYMSARFNDLALGLDPSSTTSTNMPTNTIRWNSVGSANKWEKWNGTSWVTHSAYYNISINGSVGATTPNTGAFTTLSSSGTTALAAGTTIGGVAAVTISGTQTLTNKTLTAPIISTISNTGTLTLPTTTDTLVGQATTDTLSNKTLTAPKFANGGYIADANGVSLISFTTTASAVNYLNATNAATGGAPTITATGTDTNVSINIVPKGTGTVQAGGVTVVTVSGTQTLTNKTLTSPVISTITNTGTLTLPTSTDTLVGRSTTDILSNKTLTAPRFVNAGYIADNNGVAQLLFNTTGSAVNYVSITNAATGAAPAFSTEGADANIDLNLVAKGTGIVRADGVPVVTTTDTQTLTNKTWNGVSIAVLYGGTGATDAAGARTNLGVPANDGTGAGGTWGINITGNAGTVTNGVYNTGTQTLSGTYTFSNIITGSITGNAGTVTNGVYNTGTQTLNGTYTISTPLTLSGTRPITTDQATGSIYVQGDSAGWAMQYAFKGSGGASLGGYGATGSGTSFTEFWIGPAYNSKYATITSSTLTVPGLIDAGNGANLRTTGALGSQRMLAKYYTAAGVLRYQWGLESDERPVLWVYNTAGTYTGSYYFDAGNLTASGNVTGYSDERLKKDWISHPVDFIEKLSKVKNGTYTRIDTGEVQTGVSAQSLKPVLPEAVLENANGILSVAYGQAAMTSVIELSKEVVRLRNLVNNLLNKLA